MYATFGWVRKRSWPLLTHTFSLSLSFFLSPCIAFHPLRGVPGDWFWVCNPILTKLEGICWQSTIYKFMLLKHNQRLVTTALIICSALMGKTSFFLCEHPDEPRWMACKPRWTKMNQRDWLVNQDEPKGKTCKPVPLFWSACQDLSPVHQPQFWFSDDIPSWIFKKRFIL